MSAKETIAATALTWLLAACGNEDRMAVVSCTNDASGITASFSPPTPLAGGVGMLSGVELLPGEVLAVGRSSGSGKRATATIAQLLPVGEADFGPAQRQNFQFAPLLSGPLSIAIDADVRQETTADRANLRQRIFSGTKLLVVDFERRDLREPLRLIDSSPSLVAEMRDSSKDRRYILISGISTGSAVALHYFGKFISVNTLELGRYYLHVRYACGLTSERPVVIFYMPVEYDERRSAVTISRQPLDLSQYQLTGFLQCNNGAAGGAPCPRGKLPRATP